MSYFIKDNSDTSILVIESKTYGEFRILVDTFRVDELRKYSWNINKQGKLFYARSRELGLLHRYILNYPSIVDHINNNTLDNREKNLRPCTSTQNQANSKRLGKYSKYKGVHVERRYRTIKYRAQIQVNKVHLFGPTRNCEVEAAIDYNIMALTHFGEFAKFNEILENPNLDLL